MMNTKTDRIADKWRANVQLKTCGIGWTALPFTRGSVVSKIGRYGVAVFAPASVAVAQLLVQLIILRQASAAEFGLYAFLMVIVQLGYGVSNALICTPFTVLRNHASEGRGDQHSFFTINCIYAALFGIVCAGLGALFQSDSWLFVFALYASAAMLRWFGRAYAYANFRQLNAAASDIVYAGSLVASTCLLYAFGHLDMFLLSAALLVSTLFAISVIGREFIGRQLSVSFASGLSSYKAVWREQSRWTLLGVATTEATSNAHSYLVTAFAGPAAFAPLAAAAIFIKPVALAITSLTQLERPAMSKALASGENTKADAVRKDFLTALVCVWLVVAGFTGVVLWLWPELVAHHGYSLFDLRMAAALLAAIALVQIWQSPNSVYLQAAKEFRVLSTFSVKACLVSLPIVAIAIVIFGPVYSLCGILAGQTVMAVQISAQVRKWRSNNE
jgi:O-antigen/teichoic acid export membrane protein